MDLHAPVQYVKGIGPQKAEALAKVGVRTTEDLLLHLPMRYEDRRSFARVADLRPGMRVSVSGEIAVAGLRRARRMTIYEVRLDDGSGRLKAVFFNQPYLKETLARGKKVVFFGLVEPDAMASRLLVMRSPQYEIVEGDEHGGVHTGRLVPVYEKLGPLTVKPLRRILAHLAEQVPAGLEDPLPPDLRERLRVIGRGEALRRVHLPGEADDLDLLNRFRSPGHLRLIVEELLLFQLGLARRRSGLRAERKRAAFEITDAAREAVKRILPFPLTDAQKRVLREIAEDLRSPHPMNRLVQGDVGSGKTLVALLSMVVVLENGHQSAFMAPTEILAEQHFLTLRRLLKRCPYRVELLTSAVKGRERAQTLARIASGGGADRDRHPRAHPGGRLLQAPGPRGRRRATPVRRPAAGGPAEEGLRRGRAGHDRHADPAYLGAHRVRRSRRVDRGREAAGPHADPHRAAGGLRAARRARPGEAGGRAGAAGLRRLPARRGVGEAGGRQGRDRGLPGVGGGPAGGCGSPSCTGG